MHVIDSLHRLPRSPLAATWAMRAGGAVAVVMLARLLVLGISDAQLPMEDAPTASAAFGNAQEPVASWHLFGIPANDSQVETTTLALLLRGTVESNTPAFATAIIAGQDQKDAGYHVGDALPGGGVLEAIHADHVVIRNNGRRESLALTDKPVDRETGTTASPAPSVATGSAPAIVVGATGERAALVSPQTVGAAALGSSANVLPVVENQQVVGARISVPDVALLERVGLRRDDVITSIDGQAVAGTGIDQTLANRLRAGDGMILVVRRDGREQTVRIGH